MARADGMDNFMMQPAVRCSVRRLSRLGVIAAIFCGALVASTAVESPPTAEAADYGELVVLQSNKCVDISGVSVVDGAPVVQWSCNGGDNQLFTQVPAADGFMLKALHSGKCITIENAGTGNGARAIQMPCVGSTNQIVRLINGNQYQFLHSNRCLEVPGGNTGDGAALAQYTCTNVNWHRFNYTVRRTIDPIPDDGLGPIAVAGSKVVSRKTEVLAAGVVGINYANDTFPNTNITVTAFAEIGDVIYVGGKFTQVEIAATRQRQNQRFLAAFDRTTGEWISSFRPNVNGNVWDLKATTDGRLIVAGQFTNVNGEPDTAGIAMLDATTGAVDPTWRVSLTLTGSTRWAIARALDIEGDWLYVGGNFTRMKGADGRTSSVGQMARVSLTTGRVDGAFRPNFDGVVFDVDATADRAYAVGNFYYVNGVWSIGQASLQASNGQLVPGLPAVRRNELRNTSNSYQQAVIVVGGKVWVSGSQHHRHVYNESNFAFIREWTSSPWGDGQALAELNGVIYSGSHANGRTRLYQDAYRYQDLAGTTSSAPARWFEAIDADNPAHITSFYPAIGVANGEGAWELFADSSDCLWAGGDFNRGSYDGNTPRYVQGFAKFCSSDQTPPAPPTRPRAKEANGGVDLSWTASTGDDRGGQVRYEVLKNDRIFASYIGITTFRDPNGLPTDRYFVRSMDKAGNRSATTRVFSTGGPDTIPPTTPQDLAAVVEPNKDVTLTWTEAIDDGGVTGYVVYRNGVEIARPATTTYVVPGPGAGDHWYQVSAFDAAGNEGNKAPSVRVTIEPDDVDPPKTPQDLAAVVEDSGDVTLTWTAPADDVGVTGYIVFRNGDEIARTVDPTYLVPAPGAGNHFFQVSAFDAAGNEGNRTASVEVTITGLDTSPPKTPQDLIGVVEANGDVTLTWTEPADDVGVTGYVVFRNGDEIARTVDPTYVVVTPGAGQHWYQVRAFDAAGNESNRTPSTLVTIVGADTTPPKTPQDLVGVVEANGDVTLTWTAPADDVGVTGYIVFRNGDEIARSVDPTYVVPAPGAGSHFYQVRAFDAAGNEGNRTPSTRIDI